MAMRLLDLFSGIGGFSYAAEKLIGGYETVAFCEMDEFCEPEHIPRVTKGEKDRAKKLKALGNSIVPQVAAEILLARSVREESV